MTQLDLFDALPLTNPVAHAADPATSHEAAAEHTASGKREAHARLVLRLVRRHPGCTAVELWTRATEFERFVLCEMQECRRRLTDLHAAGLVRQGPARACGVRGTKQVVWEAVSFS